MPSWKIDVNVARVGSLIFLAKGRGIFGRASNGDPLDESQGRFGERGEG